MDETQLLEIKDTANKAYDLAGKAVSVAETASTRAAGNYKVLTGVDLDAPSETPRPEGSVLTQLSQIKTLMKWGGVLIVIATTAIVAELAWMVFH